MGTDGAYSLGRSRPSIAITGGGQGGHDVAQRRHTRQPCRGDVDATGHGRALARDAERVEAVDEDRWRTDKPSLLSLFLAGNHRCADGLRRQAHPLER